MYWGCEGGVGGVGVVFDSGLKVPVGALRGRSFSFLVRSRNSFRNKDC